MSDDHARVALKHAAVFMACMIAAIPVVGFVAGLVFCYIQGESVVYYPLAGVIHAISTTLGLGFFWVEHDRVVNGWPYIVPIGHVFYFLVVLARRLCGKRLRNKPIAGRVR